MTATEQSTFGKSLDETTIKEGLRELNPSIHFDMLTNIGQVHPYQADRQGVFCDGRHICSMDRGQVPEFKVWSVADGIEEIDPVDADRYDNVFCVYVEVLPNDPFYNEALTRAESKDDRFTLEDTGKVFRWTHMRFTKTKSHVIRVGWRHTFEKLLAVNLPNITRESLGLKFGVDMYKYPVGEPEEVEAALHAE